jgi:hypothetical protein
MSRERSASLNLELLDQTFAICRLDSRAQVPAWAAAAEFLSLTRTAEELSIVCRQDWVPMDAVCERGWRCLRVAGKIPFTAVGVLASLAVPLAEAGISLFAVSTFDTDYLLVKEHELMAAAKALRSYGHTVPVED